MIKDIVSNVIYTEVDEAIGPNPKVSYPEISMETSMLIGIKTITLLSGEHILPKSLVIIPFPSLEMKGLIKYVEWNDEKRRGGVGRSAVTLLFKELNDAVFYKYMIDLEALFDELAIKLGELELAEAANDVYLNEIKTFTDNLIELLEGFKDKEITKPTEAFPIKEEDVKKDWDYKFKVVVCGDPSVGKTSTILRFTDNAFKRTYLPTIGVNISEKGVKVGDTNIQLVIWDLAGQTKFDTMRTHFYQKAEGIFLIFDLTRQKTFDSIASWYEDLRRSLQNMAKVKGFILGNKSDMINEREVARADAEALAKDLGYEYYETSALTGENVQGCFEKIAHTLLNLKKIMKLKRI